MKKIIYTLVLLSIPFLVKSQFYSDLVVFNTNGDLFKLYINNSLVNNQYANKVRVNDLNTDNYTLNIVFDNTNLYDLKLDIYIQDNSEIACSLVKENNFQYSANIFQALSYLPPNTIADNVQPMPPIHQYEPQNTYNGFCPEPMPDDLFSNALSTIDNQSFDDKKMKIAQQIASSNCLYAGQIKEICTLFSFESSKIEFAKFAYTHTFDPNNYFVINEIFDFSSSIDELYDYINSL